MDNATKILTDSPCPDCGNLCPEGTMFCDNCGAKLQHKACPDCGNLCREGAMFCDVCGAKLTPKACPECGNTQLRSNAKFCDLCGCKLSGSDSSKPAPAVAGEWEDPALAGPSKDELQVGSYVNFGTLMQDNIAPSPIEWLVLENNGKTALLISKYGLDCKYFNGEMKFEDDVDSLDFFATRQAMNRLALENAKELGWDNCTLRNWLNEEFLEKAFSMDEQKRIAESVLFTGNNPESKRQGCGETRDKVFCLSLEEANRYFASEDRLCKATAWAVSNGLVTTRDGYCNYWLRSPGYSENLTVYVSYEGVIKIGGYDANAMGHSIGTIGDDTFAVRPALRITI